MDEPAEIDILGSVFALVEKPSGDEPLRYLGTAFFADERGTFLTAGHVLRDRTTLVAAVMLDHAPEPGGRPRAAEVSEIVIADDVDLARDRVDVPRSKFIPIAQTPPKAGGDVLAPEYSRSTLLDPETNSLGFADPQIQKGHIVRAFSTESSRAYDSSSAVLRVVVPGAPGRERSSRRGSH